MGADLIHAHSPDWTWSPSGPDRAVWNVGRLQGREHGIGQVLVLQPLVGNKQFRVKVRFWQIGEAQHAQLVATELTDAVG